MNWKLLLFLPVLFCSNRSFAQNAQTDSLKGQNSLFVTTFNDLSVFAGGENFMKGNSWGLTAGYNFSMQKNNSDWVRTLNVKNVALVFTYLNMDDVFLPNTTETKGFLGDAYNVTSQLDILLFHINKTDVMLSPGFGFSYVTQTFRTTDNKLVGTHINLNEGLGIKVDIPFIPSTKIRTGLGLFHFSNMAYKLPNEGVNSINISLGIVKNLNTFEQERKIAPIDTAHKSAFEFGLGIGHRGLTQQFGMQAPSLSDSLQRKNETSNLNHVGLYVGYNYRLNSFLSLKGASDVVYYTTTFNVANYKTTTEDYGTSVDKLSVGVSGGIDIWLNRLVFEGNYGYYLHLKYATTPVHTYWTIGIKYYFTPWLAFEAKGYLHVAEAHYANFGVLFHIH